MTPLRYAFPILMLAGALISRADAQSTTTRSQPAVPRLVNYSGKVLDPQAKPVMGAAGVTFAIYADQYDGAPLWQETQNIVADSKGNYTTQLGRTTSAGIPLDLFSSGQARWLGVALNGGQEQPRVLLLSVPYALKAADADTIGGLPPSAFVMAGLSGGSMVAGAPRPAGASIDGPAASPNLAGSGTLDFIPLWTPNGNTLGNSALFQSGTGSSANIGIDTTTPATPLDVQGSATIRGNLNLPASGLATAAAGKPSEVLNMNASSFKSGGAAVQQSFRLEAEPAGNNTSAPSATLNFLFGSGSAAPVETGLKINSNGQIAFAPGQTFPGGGGGVTSVALSAPASDFTVTGSPVTSSGTLALKWKIAPTNLATPSTIVKRDSLGSVNFNGVVASGFFGTFNGNFNGNLNGLVNVPASAVPDGAAGVVSESPTGIGVWGIGDSDEGVEGSSNSGVGVYGYTASAGSPAVYAENSTLGDSSDGLWAFSQIETAVYANSGSGTGLYASVNVSGGTAGLFGGDVIVFGNISKSGGSFKIDHPLDPANKYLSHSFVESPDMKNIYDGVAVLDADGHASVQLPEWFETLNRDFRYQLTCIGGFAPVYVAAEVANNQFQIAGGQSGMKVSWQITGIRQDAWANAHRIPVEETKPDKELGTYIHPELFGQPEQKGVQWARRSAIDTRAKEMRARHAARERALAARH